MASITEKVEEAGITFAFSALTYSNESQYDKLTDFRRSGLRVLVCMFNAAAPMDQLSQQLINLDMLTGYALLTPTSQQVWGNRGNNNGKPLLGIISSVSPVPPSAALDTYQNYVASECANGGNTLYDGKTYTNRWFYPNAPVVVDSIHGMAAALDAVLNANGGASSCKLEPGMLAFQLKLREQLYATSFNGLTGPVAVTQCASADFSKPSLVDTPENCGDRVGMVEDLIIYSEQNDPDRRTYNPVTKWRTVGSINVANQTLQLSSDAVVMFLGNSQVVPVAVVDPPTCMPGQFKNQFKQCVACQPGRYSDTEDVLMCSPCPSGASLLCTINLNILPSSCIIIANTCIVHCKCKINKRGMLRVETSQI